METAQFDYNLPSDLIAQVPAPTRDASRLLVLERSTGRVNHHQFRDFPDFLRSGDVLVLNNSKVLPARLRAVKQITGGEIEVLLLEEIARNEWWAMLKPGKRAHPGTILHLLDRQNVATRTELEVIEKSPGGHYRLRFRGTDDITAELPLFGEIPLPPYIRRPTGAEPDDSDRYQTVFAQLAGSVAAPTAGLHFTPEILKQIRAMRVEIVEVTLHVGLGTFAPVKVTSLNEHQMHEERYSVSPAAAEKIAAAKTDGRRVVAVGTPSLRVLESVAAFHGAVVSDSSKTRLFAYPPFKFKVVDALLTNFHLPQSTLLMLVSAFASPGKTDGRDLIIKTYQEAIRERYRFFSYGDAMLIL